MNTTRFKLPHVFTVTTIFTLVFTFTFAKLASDCTNFDLLKHCSKRKLIDINVNFTVLILEIHKKKTFNLEYMILDSGLQIFYNSADFKGGRKY